MTTRCALPCHLWLDDSTGPKRIVTEANSGLVYRSGDPDNVIIGKLFGLGVATIPVALPIRMTTRLILLVTGSWISSGYDKTQKVWNKLYFNWYYNEQNLPVPTSSQYYQILAENIGTELIDQVAKCISLPLAAIALTFVAFAGLLNPLDGRKIYSDIERLWSIRLPESITDRSIMSFCNYTAPCMQPKSTYKEQNLFRFYQYANPSLGCIYALEQLEWDGFVTLGKDLKTWKTAVKQNLNDQGELQNLVNACNERLTLITSNATQDLITACEQKMQASIDKLRQLLTSSASESENLETN